MLCLLVDVVLDPVSSVGVMAILAAQYLPDHNTSTANFGIPSCLSNSLWYSYMTTEFRQLFVQSWFDLATRMLFALMVLLIMDDVKLLASVVDSFVSSSQDPESNLPRFWSHRIETCVHMVIVAWGFLILGFHIEACHAWWPAYALTTHSYLALGRT